MAVGIACLLVCFGAGLVMTVGDVLSGWCGGAAPVKYTVFVHLKR